MFVVVVVGLAVVAIVVVVVGIAVVAIVVVVWVFVVDVVVVVVEVTVIKHNDNVSIWKIYISFVIQGAPH